MLTLPTLSESMEATLAGEVSKIRTEFLGQQSGCAWAAVSLIGTLMGVAWVAGRTLV